MTYLVMNDEHIFAALNLLLKPADVVFFLSPRHSLAVKKEKVDGM